jgi:hypothetical protein
LALLVLATWPAAAEPALPAAVQTALLTIVQAEDAHRPFCPDMGAIAALAQQHPDLVIPITEVAADRIRVEPNSEDESRCTCAVELAAALTQVSPEQAGGIRNSVAEWFPVCDAPVSAAMEDSLASPSAGGTYKPWTYTPLGPPPFGGNGPGHPQETRCTSGCASVEPGNDDTVSGTIR